MKSNIFICSHTERRLLMIMAVLLVGMVGLYIYFVASMTFAAMAHKKASRAVSALSSQVGDLESTYIAKKRDITLEYAYAQGYYESDTPLFVSRGSGKSLTFNTE